MAIESILPTTRQRHRLDNSILRLLRRIPQFTRTSRHFWSLVKHSTPRKIANLLLVEAEYRLRRTQVRGRPYIIIVDPLNVCNLRCPLCPTGTDDLGRKGQKMSWEVFQKTIDEMAPYAYEVNLHNWGESLLHPNIFEMIAYVASKNIATNMSTNFNLVTDKKIDQLINSGLEYLILSIDGISSETYDKYRVRGNLDKVLANVKKLIQRRRELHSSTPYLEWQFIVFKHNAHEVEAARELAMSMGVDRFRIIPPGLPFTAKDPEQLRREWFVPKTNDKQQEEEPETFREEISGPCFYLYRSFTTNPDGGTAPCCIVYGKDNDFGDIKTQNFHDIWNNEKYLSARSQYRDNGKVTTPTICDGCTIFKKRTQPPSKFLNTEITVKIQ